MINSIVIFFIEFPISGLGLNQCIPELWGFIKEVGGITWTDKEVLEKNSVLFYTVLKWLQFRTNFSPFSQVWEFEQGQIY